MNFVEELRWRGLLHDATPGVEEYLAKGSRRAYIGFDPTAPSLTIGNLVPITMLMRFQQFGHQPIVLMGGATGRIGDPSGKDEERQLKTYDELDHNLAHQLAQMKKFLRFDDSASSARVVNNYDIYKDMDVLTFLRDVGKRMTINYMMSKDSVKNRLEKGISFTEFSYQLLQGYDFQWLYEHMDVRVQMGGSDQWGNITGGTELIRRNLSGKAYAITCPLLTKADGAKFGKSEKGNIWLDPTMTSPYEFYQFWINAADADLPRLLRTFSFMTQDEIEALEAEHAEAPHLRKAQKALAEEMTARIHSAEDLEAAIKVSELLFDKKADAQMLGSMSASALALVQRELTSYEVPRNAFEGEGVNIMALLADLTAVTTSKSDARRAIKGGAISVNKVKVADHEAAIKAEDLLHGAYLMIENGKKNKYMVKAV